jgi:hypothetical protein
LESVSVKPDHTTDISKESSFLAEVKVPKKLWLSGEARMPEQGSQDPAEKIIGDY